MLMNPYMVKGGFNPLEVSAVKGWYATPNRASRRQGSFTSNQNLDGDTHIYALANSVAAAPRLWQGTNEDWVPAYVSGNGTINNNYGDVFNGHANWLSSLEAGKPYAASPENAASFPIGSTEGWIIGYFSPQYQYYSGDLILFGYGGSNARCIGLRSTNPGSQDYCYPTISLSNSGSAIKVGATERRSQHLLIEAHFVNGAHELWINGVKDGASVSGTLNTDDTAVSMFRGPNTTAAIGCGEIGTVFVTGALTSDEREKLQGFVAWTHGRPNDFLPSGHAYRNIDPR